MFEGVVGTAYLVSEKKFPLGEIVFDWKEPEKNPYTFIVGGFAMDAGAGKPGGWNRTVVTCTARTIEVLTNGEKASLALIQGDIVGDITFKGTPGLEIMNVFVREVKKK